MAALRATPNYDLNEQFISFPALQSALINCRPRFTLDPEYSDLRLLLWRLKPSLRTIKPEEIFKLLSRDSFNLQISVDQFAIFNFSFVDQPICTNLDLI